MQRRGPFDIVAHRLPTWSQATRSSRLLVCSHDSFETHTDQGLAHLVWRASNMG